MISILSGLHSLHYIQNIVQAEGVWNVYENYLLSNINSTRFALCSVIEFAGNPKMEKLQWGGLLVIPLATTPIKDRAVIRGSWKLAPIQTKYTDTPMRSFHIHAFIEVIISELVVNKLIRFNYLMRKALARAEESWRPSIEWLRNPHENIFIILPAFCFLCDITEEKGSDKHMYIHTIWINTYIIEYLHCLCWGLINKSYNFTETR